MSNSIRTKAEGKRPGADMCARRILEMAPTLMRILRREMREGVEGKLSVPQFRVLGFLDRAPGASLSEVAECIGVTNATASAMVERLVKRRLVSREGDPRERRRIMLSITPQGSRLLERARGRARKRMAESLAVLARSELAALANGLDLLSRVLRPSVGSRSGA